MSWPLSVLSLSVYELFVSTPYLLNPLKDYFVTLVKYMPCQDDVQKSYFNNVRQQSRSQRSEFNMR